MRESELVFGFAGILICCTIGGCLWAIGWLLRHYPRRDEAIAAMVCDAPEVDGSVWDALDRHLADQPDEVLRDESREPVHPLMREIYAALSLARDGVDVEKGAPKEWVP